MFIATLNIKSPSSNEKFEEIVSLLDDTNLDFVKKMLANKNRLNRSNQTDVELQRRFDLIESRVNSTAAALARAIMLENPNLVTYLKNWPNSQGVATIDSPNVGEEYSVPAELNQLALFKKPGARGESIGKGEALAILMFGRETDGAGEPDLVVDADRQFSIKYFRAASATVNTGAFTPRNVQDASESTSILLEIAKRLNIYASDAGQITRSNMISVCSDLEKAAAAAEAAGTPVIGGMKTSDIRDNLSLVYKLWDDTAFSEHPVLALMGESKLVFKAVGADEVKLGVLRLEGGTHYNYEIASPIFAKRKVRPPS